MAKEEQIDHILKEQKELFLKKLSDYGTKDISQMGIEGIIVRLREKIERANNLISSHKIAQNES